MRELAHVDGGARAEKRRKAGRVRNGERFFRVLARLAVAAFEQRDGRSVLLAARALDVALAAIRTHLGGQPCDARRDTEHEVEPDEACGGEQDERVERKLDAIRRRDEQCVPIVQLEEERHEHGQSGEQQEGEENSHGRR